MKKLMIAGPIVLGTVSLGYFGASAPKTQIPAGHLIVGVFLATLFFIIAARLRRTETEPKILLWKPTVLGAFLALVPAAFIYVSLPVYFSEDQGTYWTYRSPEYGFTLTLPSSDWKEVEKPGSVVAFQNRKHPALAGVKVFKQTKEDFREISIKRLKNILDQSRDQLLTEPHYSEGKTRSGNLYAFWTLQAKAKQVGATFTAFALMWCKDKEITVQIIFEGPLNMKSEAGKEAELDYFEKAARTICLSVE